MSKHYTPTEILSSALHKDGLEPLLRFIHLEESELFEIDCNALDEPLDILCERILEKLQARLSKKKHDQETHDEIGRAVSKNALMLNALPAGGGTPREINVRAAEVLETLAVISGKLYIADYTPLPCTAENVRALLDYPIWQVRMAHTKIARTLFSKELRGKLKLIEKGDPYQDEDGYFLIREAATLPELESPQNEDATEESSETPPQDTPKWEFTLKELSEEKIPEEETSHLPNWAPKVIKTYQATGVGPKGQKVKFHGNNPEILLEKCKQAAEELDKR